MALSLRGSSSLGFHTAWTLSGRPVWMDVGPQSSLKQTDLTRALLGKAVGRGSPRCNVAGNIVLPRRNLVHREHEFLGCIALGELAARAAFQCQIWQGVGLVHAKHQNL